VPDVGVLTFIVHSQWFFSVWNGVVAPQGSLRHILL